MTLKLIKAFNFHGIELTTFFGAGTFVSNNSSPSFRLSCDGTLFGGSILMFGSHSPGGNTVT